MHNLETDTLRQYCHLIIAETILLLCPLFLTGCVHYRANPLNPTRSQAKFLDRTLQDPDLATFAREKGSSGPTWPPETLNLVSANIIAAYYNPDLAVVRARLESAKAAVITAGGRPNPQAAGAAGYETAAGSPVVIRFELSLPIETAGKRHYRILTAQEELGAARVGLQQAAWTTYAKARDAWFEYASATQSSDALQKETTARTEATLLLEKRLAVGEASTPDVSQARIAASQTALTLATAQGRREMALADLAATLGVPSAAIQMMSLDTSEFDNPPPLQSLSFFEVQQKGLVNRFDVRRVELEYAAADAQLHLALAQQYPDVQLNPGYDYDEGFHKYTFGPAIPIPVWNRNRGPIAEAEASRTATQARFEATQDHAISDMQHSLAQYSSALKQYQEADARRLTLQRQREQQTQRAVQLGHEDQLTLTEAKVETAVAESARADTLGIARKAFAALEDAVQAPLSKIQIIEASPSRSKRAGANP